MKTIKINTMYRDGANYKSNNEDYFSNKTRIPLEEITKAIEPLMGEPIMVQDYGISSIAPLSNEFIPIDECSLDHSYCEITEVEEAVISHTPETDIAEILRLIKEGGDKEAVKARMQEAKAMMQSAIEELDKQLYHIPLTRVEIMSTVHWKTSFCFQDIYDNMNQEQQDIIDEMTNEQLKKFVNDNDHSIRKGFESGIMSDWVVVADTIANNLIVPETEEQN